MEANTSENYFIHDNYKFRVGSTSKAGTTRWRCCKKNCSATLYTIRREVINFTGPHCHEQPNVQADVLRRTCKRKALDDLTCKPSKIIKTEHFKSGDIQIEAGDYKRIREAIYRERRKKYPVLPKSHEEVFQCLESIPLKTAKGEDFILELDAGNSMVLFSCKENLEFLSSCEDILCDGTFKCVPKHFEQMYVIVGHRQGCYIPLVFVLMTERTEEKYNCMWSKLKGHCESADLILRPSIIMMDFEKAAMNSAVSAFPAAKLHGCRFHLAQAWFRKIQSLGLSSQYNAKESEVSKWLSYFFGLPFLRPGEVSDCFTDDLFAITPNDERCDQFADYVLVNFVDSNSKFPPSLWAFDDASLRTNNGCESFNGHFNKEFYSTHPNIYSFIDVLVKYQTASSAKMRSANMGKVSYKDNATKELQNRTMDLITRRNAGEIETFAYVKLLGYTHRV